MNEELDSQLSAMFDDELPEAECQLLARRLSRDDALKARWRRYAVMGAALRSERGVRLEANLADRVSAAISAEPALLTSKVAHGKSDGKSFRWWHPVAGGAIAAGVAAMSILWIRSQAPIGSETLVAQNSAPTTIVGQQRGAVPEPADSYVVPTNVEPRSFVPPAELANYVVAHSEFSTPVTRRNLLSTLVASESGNSGAAIESENAKRAGNGGDETDALEVSTQNVEKAR
jgi:sigma-E factor negative regulatory protein RseA